MRIETLRALNPACERLLRARAEEKGREPAESLRQIGEALAARKAEGIALYDDASVPCGIATWRWVNREQTHAQVIMLYTPPSTPAALGQALVDYVFSELARAAILEVIEVRVRDESPGVREAWAEHDLVFFDRWQMARPLGATPLPLVPVPTGYTLTGWQDDHQAAVEQVAVAAYRDTIESVVVPDPQGSRVVDNLRKQRADAEGWNSDASLVVLDKRSQPAGYIAVLKSGREIQIDDLAVHPGHRRKGLARLLLVRAMLAAQRQGYSAVSLSVTAANPVCTLYNRVGFQPTNCGEVAIWWRDGRQLEWEP